MRAAFISLYYPPYQHQKKKNVTKNTKASEIENSTGWTIDGRLKKETVYYNY